MDNTEVANPAYPANYSYSLCPHLEGQPPPNDGRLYCPPDIDEADLCWNYTLAGTNTSQRCPPIFQFNTNEFASRRCMTNGEWFINPSDPNRTWTNFARCLTNSSIDVYIYYSGYSVSILALLVSLFIFFKFRQLQCDRVTLHKHLFIAYLLNAIIWICYYSILQDTQTTQANTPTCQAIHLVATYLSCATYLWMFCEGLYLLIILKVAFIKGRALIYSCMHIGWGLPLILTIIYGLARGFLEKPGGCWIENTAYAYIMQIPVTTSLILNFIFVLIVLHLLMTKLQNPTSPAQQQGRKTAKAILILVPLLGLQYMVTLIAPSEGSSWLNVYQYTNAVLVSFQGLLVATLLCFCNQEVHAAWRANSQRLAYTVGLPQGTTRSSERPRSRGRGPSTPEPDSDLALKTASA